MTNARRRDVDPLGREGRRQLMRRVRTRDTAAELRLRRALWRAGVRGWRVDARQVVGRPDLAWRALRLAVFVDGAFWHGHPDYYRGQSGPFWDEKLKRNRERDARVNAELSAQGWVVIRLWDFEVERNLEQAVALVRGALEARRQGEPVAAGIVRLDD